MGILTRLYDRLAADGRLDTLMCLGMLDERVYEVVERHKLVPAIVDTLPSPLSAAFLARGMCYDCIGDEVIRNFIPICMMLSRYRSVAEGATLAELIGNCGLPEHHRMHMFNFSETYRHMILSESYFPQRAVLRLLSYVFCDDVLSDAVAQLQYKSDILNHINKVYVTTPDFVSWRFSVRCMSLAGGFNEDRSDVDETERLTQLVTRMLPEFALYFVPALVYARFRHYPRRVRGIVPRWLAYQRALFSASCTGVLGLYSNSLLEYRLQRHRALYELRCSQEQRRRGGALRRSTHYEPNVYFDNLVGVTQRVYAMQLTAYTCTAAALCCSLLPLASVTFPRWMGDVAWRHPFLPRLFPALFGMHTASRCLVPFVLAPFTIVSLVRWQNWGTTVYDGYVELRHRLWHRRAQLAYESVTDGVDADVTQSDRRAVRE